MKEYLMSLFFCWFTNVSAQNHLPCKNGRIDTAALNKIILFEENRMPRPLSSAYLVKVYFSILNDDNGDNAAASNAQIETEFISMRNSYAARGICFINMGTNQIKSSALNNNFNADNDPTGAAFNPYRVPDCVNIFYMQAILGNNTACNPPCGYGGIAIGGIPGNFFLMSTGNIGGKNSIGHEMGHSLGLLHSFEDAYGLEKIDGSNNTTAGDRIEDTPADPFVYNGDPCFATSGCLYTGTCTDPNGQSNFTVPYNNLMGYWSSNTCYANPVATTRQFDRVETTIITAPFLIPDLGPCIAPLLETVNTVTVSSGYFMKAGVQELSTSGNVILNGTVKSTLGAGRVTLTPGFVASPTGNDAFIKIITNPCN